MKKKELRSCYFEVGSVDEKERNVYLQELGDSVHNYIKTGVKNEQLENLSQIEAEFQEKYENRFNVKYIADMISQCSKDAMKEIEFSEATIKLNEKVSQDEDALTSLIQKTSEQIIDSITSILNEKIEAIMRDAAYLSHVNMLYELYEKEEKLRREELEYEKMSERFQHLADITRQLSKTRRLEITELQAQTQLAAHDLEDTLVKCNNYFNIRDNTTPMKISLTPKGKRFNSYIMNAKDKYSRETLNQLVYKNCDNLLESLEKSFERGVEYEPTFEQISSERERALQFKYNQIMNKMVSEFADIYPVRVYAIKEEGEHKEDGDEKNMFRIPRGWNKETF